MSVYRLKHYVLDFGQHKLEFNDSLERTPDAISNENFNYDAELSYKK